MGWAKGANWKGQRPDINRARTDAEGQPLPFPSLALGCLHSSNDPVSVVRVRNASPLTTEEMIHVKTT